MAMYSCQQGMPDDFYLVHLGSRALGGCGLLFTEMTAIAPEARITPGCAGLWSDDHTAAWRRIVAFVHAQGDSKIAIQLGHAGRKGSTRLAWEQTDEPLAEGNWPLLSASPLPYLAHSQVPAAATRQDMAAIQQQFVDATRRAAEAGFDMLELHCAHGYLLSSFLSPLTNQRQDEYGGSLDKRCRFPLEVFAAMRAVWPAERPMAVRLSCHDWFPGGNTGDEAVQRARITGFIRSARHTAIINGSFIGIYRLPDLPQSNAKFLLLAALHRQLHQGQNRRSQHPDNDHSDHHFDQCEAG
jgi:anthraniloyl-CoA monooxygenase